MPPKRKFSFEIIDLIEAVESKKCLWDKRSDEYKDRNLKDRESNLYYTLMLLLPFLLEVHILSFVYFEDICIDSFNWSTK